LVPEVERRIRVIYEAPDPIYGAEGETHVQDRPYFVFVGTIEPRKNLDSIVRALTGIPAGRRPELRVVGAAGSAAAAVSSLISSLGLERDVTFLGHRPTEEVAALYRGALALIYPSLLEGFGLPILEAMACGAPVITSDRSSMAEVAGGAAMLVDPGDVAALADAMDRAASAAGWRARLREQGLRRAAEFSWQRAAIETLAAFQEALTAG